MEITERIKKYWNQRANDFADLRIAELKSEKRNIWIEIICGNLRQDKKLKILDVGTGSGFLAILMASLGHEVYGIDLSPQMIDNAIKTSESLGYNIDFKVGNAQELDFKNEYFDLVISRNLTWTLPDTVNAYKEWARVLKVGGNLINFDANYGDVSFLEQVLTLDKNHAHSKIDSSLMKECDEIKDSLKISSMDRPNWDMGVLKEIGFECSCDFTISDKVYATDDELKNPTQMFGIYAVKI